MVANREDYDLILVIGYFRSAMPMLSIVRHLSTKLRIGLYFQPLNKKMEVKNGNTQKKFERLCVEAGGIYCERGSPAKCRLMLVQQYIYTEDFAVSVRADIDAREIWAMLSLASMGIEAHDVFLEQFNVMCLTVPDLGLANFLIDVRNACSRYRNLTMIEVGFPFQKYPIFDEFSADWIVAAPTLFSFHSEGDKQNFIRDVLKLLDQIPASDVVAYKPHNGIARDYFKPKFYSEIASIISWIPRAEDVLNSLMLLLPPPMKVLVSKVLTALLHARLMQRTIPMIELTPMADMSMEAFLPKVRKGVIGGESNTMWSTLFFNLQYYNCVSPDKRTSSEPPLLEKSGDKLLSMNLKYFGVPYCQGLITQGPLRPDIAFNENRHTNLIELIITLLIE